MSVQDLELNCGVRNVLSRHWIDLTKTSFFARKGHVHLAGEVRVIGEAAAPTTAEALKDTEAEIRRLRDVKTISFEFTNWVRDGAGVWISLEKSGDEEPEPKLAGGSDPTRIVDLDAKGAA